jgi:5-methylcytosine-specific restriction endonuclease McrA
MPEHLQKNPRLKLNAEEYTLLRKAVLQRDAWRCQECGSMGQLEVHHLIKRSQLGNDSMDNLITLCAHCHRDCHNKLGRFARVDTSGQLSALISSQ